MMPAQSLYGAWDVIATAASGSANPVSRAGVVALLDAVIRLKHENTVGDVEEMPAFDLFELRAIEHARDAIKAGAGC